MGAGCRALDPLPPEAHPPMVRVQRCRLGGYARAWLPGRGVSSSRQSRRVPQHGRVQARRGRGDEAAVLDVATSTATGPRRPSICTSQRRRRTRPVRDTGSFARSARSLSSLSSALPQTPQQAAGPAMRIDGGHLAALAASAGYALVWLGGAAAGEALSALTCPQLERFVCSPEVARKTCRIRRWELAVSSVPAPRSATSSAPPGRLVGSGFVGRELTSHHVDG